MNRDLSKGSVVKSMLLFAIPMILGDLLQQCYNIADTLIVGQFLGEKALAAVGSSFTLMTFITSIILGLCMGSGALFSIRFGQRDENGLKEDICASFFFITAVTILLNIIAYISLSGLRTFLRVPDEVWGDMKEYLFVIFMGIPAVFLYNYFASYLRAIGNSVIPLAFLAVSSILNIILDLWFVIGLKLGVAGAAQATVISQYLSGVGIMVYTLMRYKQVCAIWKIRYLKKERIREIISFSMLTCIQQSVMNLGILMVQGLVNSFGTVVMAAFAAAVKIDAFAYMPVQDFGNAFSTFIAQNYGAKEKKRIQQSIMNFGILMVQGLVNSFGVIVMAGFAAAVKIDSFAYMPVQDFGNAFSTYVAQNRGAGKMERIEKGKNSALKLIVGSCVVISTLVVLFAGPLMRLFIDASETQVIFEGVRYLRIVSPFYCLIGFLFLLYGLYRGIGKPQFSIVLTIISLGTRVLLAYVLSAIPAVGIVGIWWAIPIGWFLADTVGFLYYHFMKK